MPVSIWNVPRWLFQFLRWQNLQPTLYQQTLAFEPFSISGFVLCQYAAAYFSNDMYANSKIASAYIPHETSFASKFVATFIKWSLLLWSPYLKVMFVWSHAGQASGDYILLGGYLNVSHLNWMKDIQTSQAQHGEHRYHYNLTLGRLSLRLLFRKQVKTQSVSEITLSRITKKT